MEKRQQREQDRDGVGACVVEVLELLEDEEGKGFGLAGDLAGDNRDRPELAEHARGAEDDAVGDAPADRRQGDAPEGLPGARAQGRCRLLLLGADLLQDGDSLANHEGHRDEDAREDHPGDREEDLDASFGESGEPAADPVEQEEREADHHRGDREREVDHRVEEDVAAPAVADEQQRAADPKDGVERHRDRDHQQRQLQGMQRVGGGDRFKRGREAVFEGLVEDQHDRGEQEHA